MATIKDTILSFPGVFDGEDFLNNVVLINRSLDGAVEYNKKKKEDINLAVADVYAMIGGLPDFTENKLSLKYPRSWYVDMAKKLYRENGEPDNADALERKGPKVPRGKTPQSW